MSTILKALRRLEQEQDRQADVERLHGEVVAPHPNGRSIWLFRGLLIAVLALLTLGAGAAGYLWLSGGLRPPESVAAAPAPVVPRPPPSPPQGAQDGSTSRRDVSASPTNEPATAAGSASPPIAPGTVVAVPVPAPVRPPTRVSEPLAPPPAAEAASVRRVEDLPVASNEAPTATPSPIASPPPAPARAKPPVEKQVARVTEPRPIETLPEATQPRSTSTPVPGREPATRSAPPTQPTAHSQSAKVKIAPSPAPASPVAQKLALDPVPQLKVVKTVWHPRPERRVAHVRVDGGTTMIELHEGDVYKGLQVKEIKLSGVTFEHAGISISRRIGHD